MTFNLAFKGLSLQFYMYTPMVLLLFIQIALMIIDMLKCNWKIQSSALCCPTENGLHILSWLKSWYSFVLPFVHIVGMSVTLSRSCRVSGKERTGSLLNH